MGYRGSYYNIPKTIFYLLKGDYIFEEVPRNEIGLGVLAKTRFHLSTMPWTESRFLEVGSKETSPYQEKFIETVRLP